MQKFPAGNVGDIVKVRILDVERPRSDLINCLTIIIAVQDDQLYELETKHRILSHL